mgnify:CR=1 FL=1
MKHRPTGEEMRERIVLFILCGLIIIGGVVFQRNYGAIYGRRKCKNKQHEKNEYKWQKHL